MAEPDNREGGVEAPTRHPIRWQEPDFLDEGKLFAELERVFDICHGCRRCVSLCKAFPTLFDLVDESATMEVDGVARADYLKVVDECYLCDLCYQTKCPYVPPHPWEVDFPHLMLRAKAFQFQRDGTTRRRKLLSEPDRVGRMATLPVTVKLVNKVNQSPRGRKLVNRMMGIHPDAHVPPYADPRLEQRVEPEAQPPAPRAAGPTRGKVAVFGTCFGHYNRPQIAEDLIAVYRHNGIPTILADARHCCGMPKMELGDLAAVAALKERNLPLLAALVDEGHDIVTPVPSCTLMFRQELPLLFADDPQVTKVAERVFDPFEYLAHRHREGLLKTDFQRGYEKVIYQVACHQRVQNIGPRTRDLLSLLPDTELQTIERCSGHDGSYGVRAETFENSSRIAAPVVRRIDQADPAVITSDCPLAADHLGHLSQSDAPVQHPMTLLRTAYGL